MGTIYIYKNNGNTISVAFSENLHHLQQDNQSKYLFCDWEFNAIDMLLQKKFNLELIDAEQTNDIKVIKGFVRDKKPLLKKVKIETIKRKHQIYFEKKLNWCVTFFKESARAIVSLKTNKGIAKLDFGHQPIKSKDAKTIIKRLEKFGYPQGSYLICGTDKLIME